MKATRHPEGLALVGDSACPPADVGAASSWRRSGRTLLQGESGQTLVVAALCMAVLIGFLGLAVDAGQLRYQKRRMQMAADAAALAGALELTACQGIASCPILQTAARAALTENGFTGSTVLTNCAPGTGTRLEITINDPPCALKSGDPNSGKASFVEIVLSQPQPTMFARVLGINSIPILARAEAGQTGGGSTCMFALDPVGSNAIVVDFLASITSSCGIVDESSSSSALGCYFFGAIQASQINVVGGVTSSFCSIGPTPVTGVAVPTPADPLALLAKPSIPSCGKSNKSPYHGSNGALNITSNATLYPDGAYCGGITISPGANVTFTPGVYVLTSTTKGHTTSGGLTIDLGTTVNGTGVTFYNYGPTGSINFTFTAFSFGGVSLVAPTSGIYSGILFFQDPQNTSQATILGSPDWNTVLEGTYYFPKAKVVFAFDGPVNYNILVAYDIEFSFLTFGSTSTKSSFSSNYSSLANGSPVGGKGAAVVQ